METKCKPIGEAFQIVCDVCLIQFIVPATEIAVGKSLAFLKQFEGWKKSTRAMAQEHLAKGWLL